VSPRLPLLTLVVGFALAGSGCGTDEKSGSVGDTLAVDHVSVQLEKVEASVPIPKHDVTGLSLPGAGNTLFGARVRVCAEDEGAVVAADFGLDLEGGGHGQLKYPAHNFEHGFDSVRTGCDSGWLVFEVPAGTPVKRVTFHFENTGSSSMHQAGQDEVNVRFSWSVG
jgi:hypothetical protein